MDTTALLTMPLPCADEIFERRLGTKSSQAIRQLSQRSAQWTRQNKAQLQS